MGRFLRAASCLLVFLFLVPNQCLAQLEGSVQKQDGGGPFRGGVDSAGQPSVLEPRYPTAQELRRPDLQADTWASSAAPRDTWSMTVFDDCGNHLNKFNVSCGFEYLDPKLNHDWELWLTRIMHALYTDCSQFKCPSGHGTVCYVNVRNDGEIVSNATASDVPMTLFCNAVNRLRGQSILQFPPGTKRDKVSFTVSVHYGSPVGPAFRDSFGAPDPRFPVPKTAW